MPILGAIVRTHPEATAAVRARLALQPGVDIAADPSDGRLILVIEDAGTSAAATLGAISAWGDVINTSLVYEYSGPDAPGASSEVEAYTDWRDGLAKLSRRDAS